MRILKMKKRVVVTGIGVITSQGTGKNDFWKSIKDGKSGISLIERVDVSDIRTKVGAEIKDFDPTNYFDIKQTKRMDRYSQFAMVASKLAIEDSKIDLERINKDRAGVIIGTGIGGVESIENQYNVLYNKGPRKVSPLFIPMMLPNMAIGLIAIEYGFKGITECIVTACASSTNAIGEAFRKIQNDEADIIIAGGTEASLTRLSLAGFSAAKTMTLSTTPDKASRPFDLNRDGFVMAEGAGMLVMEELDRAIERGANIISEIVGYGANNDAFHITAPAEGGLGGAKCMQLAIKDANLTSKDIQYINAHGTSTNLNDKNETAGIKTVFGDYAYNLPISSSKSMTGHLLGAAGVIEAIVTIMAIDEGFLPPTINYETPDPECDLDYIPNIGRKKDITYGLTNSLGFGGHNATLIFKKY
jgi:3-oxoacyl-[acyl-carrier-protein] synthase II